MLLVVVLTPCAYAADLQRALADFDAFRMDAALAGLEAVEATSGPTAVTLYTRARIASVRSQMEAAQAIAGECVQRFPESSLCHEALGEATILEVLMGGNVLELLSAVRTTRKAWERAIELDPDNTRASLLLLRFYRQVPWIAGGSTRKAKQLQAEVARRNPAKGHEAAGLNALFDEDYARAIEHFRAAHRALPNDRDPHFNLAMAYSQAEDWPSAFATWDQMSREYPEFWRVWLQKGMAAARGNIEPQAGRAALEHFLQNAEHATDRARAEAWYGIGLLEQHDGHLQAAIDAFRQALTLHADHADARQALKSACATRGAVC